MAEFQLTATGSFPLPNSSVCSGAFCAEKPSSLKVRVQVASSAAETVTVNVPAASSCASEMLSTVPAKLHAQFFSGVMQRRRSIHIEIAVAIQRFGVGNRYAAAGGSRDGDFRISGKVLPVVDHGFSLWRADQCLGADLCDLTHRNPLSGTRPAAGAVSGRA